MYYCINCEKVFHSAEALQNHFLKCWKETHPSHSSQSSPHSEDIELRKVDDDVMNFFERIQNG